MTSVMLFQQLYPSEMQNINGILLTVVQKFPTCYQLSDSLVKNNTIQSLQYYYYWRISWRLI